MPKIPIFNQNESILPDAPPGTDIVAATGAYRGLSELGSVVNEIGLRRKEAEDQDYAFQTGLNSKRIVEERALRDQLDNPNLGHTDRVNEIVKEQVELGEQNAPSETARRMYLRSVGQDFEREVLRANAHEKLTASQLRVASFKDHYQEEAKKQLERPDDIGALKKISEIKQGYEQSLDMFPEQKKEGALAADRTIGIGVLEGYLNTGEKREAWLVWSLLNGKNTPIAARNVSPDYALSQGMIDQQERDRLVKSGKDYSIDISWGPDFPNIPQRSKIIDGLTPEDKDNFMDRVKQILKKKAESTLSTYKARKDDFVSAIKLGKESNQELRNSLIVQAKQNFSKKPDQYARELVSIIATDIVGKSATSIRDLPNKDIENADKLKIDDVLGRVRNEVLKLEPGLKNIIDQPEFGVGTADAISKMIKQVKDETKNERLKDPVAQIVDSYVNPDLVQLQTQATTKTKSTTQEYSRRLVLEQKRIGIDPPRVLQNAEAENLGNELNQIGNYKEKVVRLNELQDRYGEYFQYLVGDLVRAKKIDQSMIVASYLDNKEAQRLILKSGLNVEVGKDKGLEEDYKVKFTDSSETFAKLQESTNSSLEPFTEAMKAQAPQNSPSGPTVSYFQKATARVAAQLRMDENLGFSDSVKKAVELVTADFDVIDHKNSSLPFVSQPPPSKILIRKEINGVKIDRRRVDNYMTTARYKENLSKLDLLVPSPRQEEMGMFPDAERKKRYVEHISKNGFWRVNQAQDGLVLWVKDDNGVETKVYKMTKQQGPGVNQEREEVGDSLINITNNPDKAKNPTGVPF